MCTWLALFLGGFCLYPLCGNSPSGPLGLLREFFGQKCPIEWGKLVQTLRTFYLVHVFVFG